MPHPLTNLSGGARGLSPYDFATIYDVQALWNQGFDGSGQIIGIAGHTNIKASDAASFRSMFGLPGTSVQVVVNGRDPGIISSNEEMEADLDVEWSGAVAKGATVKFVVSASTNSSDGLDLSNLYIVNNNLASVISVSFGLCESLYGSGSSFYSSLWQQAAAQGISVFVASGDSGSAGCDVPYSATSSGANATHPANGGFGVNGLGSSAYNVAVGGSKFDDSTASATYWNIGNDSHLSSARSYIPEVTWNESSYTSSGAAGNNLYAGGGGVSKLWTTPTWQTGPGVPSADPGTPTGHHRYVPDVSLTAAGHDGYLIVQEGLLQLVGGTSAATPSLAGIMAMIDQYTGVRNGNPNTRLYPLAISTPAVFHDITAGTNAVPCQPGSPSCSAAASATAPGTMTGFSAGAGYDLATGLGSVDAYVLALNWSHAPVPLAITSIAPNPVAASTAAQTITINGSGFVSGATVKVSYDSYTGTLTVASLTSSKITAAITTGATARVWNIQVLNPKGQGSNTVPLQVNAPTAPPAITTVSPGQITGSTQAQPLTITGTGFVQGSQIQVSYAGYSAFLPVTSESATQLVATINTGTTARNWSVTVINPGGQTSNMSTFSVTAPGAAPTITFTTTLHAQNAIQILTLTGTGFVSGAKVIVEPSAGGAYTTLQGPQIVALSATQVSVNFNPGATARTWLVEVINPDGGSSNVTTFVAR